MYFKACTYSSWYSSHHNITWCNSCGWQCQARLAMSMYLSLDCICSLCWYEFFDVIIVIIWLRTALRLLVIATYLYLHIYLFLSTYLYLHINTCIFTMYVFISICWGVHRLCHMILLLLLLLLSLLLFLLLLLLLLYDYY